MHNNNPRNEQKTFINIGNRVLTFNSLWVECYENEFQDSFLRAAEQIIQSLNPDSTLEEITKQYSVAQLTKRITSKINLQFSSNADDNYIQVMRF